jgi:hypothetical protein
VIEVEDRKREQHDPVANAEHEELVPAPKEIEDAAEHDADPDKKEEPEDKHVEMPPEQLAALAGITPADDKKTADEPAEEKSEEALVERLPEPTGGEGSKYATEAPAEAKEVTSAQDEVSAKAPESPAAEDKKDQEGIEAGDFGPKQAAEQQQDEKKEPEPAQAPVDGKAALETAASAAGGVAAAAEQEHAEGKTDKATEPAKPAATAGADGFAGMGERGGKQKWNESAYYKHDNTTGFDVGGSKTVALGKGAGGKVDAADAAVYATAAVETSGTYDAIQTYDKGILSFGIMQWTLHQGSLMKFLEYLKSKCGEAGAQAFHDHFDPLGLDVSGESMIVGGATIKPDDAGRKAMDKLIRGDKDTTRRWVVAFHEAGKDERVARAQWNYTKKQYTDTAGKSLEKYLGFARKKGYSPKHAGAYHSPSFWCREPDAAALFFSMTTNNPGYSYYGVIKAADAFMDGAGVDPKAWPENWPKQFLSIYSAMLPTLIDSWKGRVEKTLQQLHLAQEGKAGEASKTGASSSTHEQAHAPRPKPPVAHVEAKKPLAPAAMKQAAQQPQPAPEEHHGLSWLADVMTRKVVRGLESASNAVAHFLGIAKTGTPTAAPAAHEAAKAPPVSEKTKQLAAKIGAVTPKAGGKPKGKLIPKEKLTKGKLSDDQYAFKQKVYEMAVGEKAAKKPAFGQMPEEELSEIENGKQLRKDVVPHAHTLLDAIRSALKTAQSNGDEKAKKVKEIGVSSGYRDPEKDFGLWDSYYAKYYEQTKDAREKTGDAHGAESLKILVRYIAPRKAPPGFSNHSGGTAMDLHAIVDGKVLGADFNNQVAWHESWVWHWLRENAGSYNFHPYDKEAWHWEWKD